MSSKTSGSGSHEPGNDTPAIEGAPAVTRSRPTPLPVAAGTAVQEELQAAPGPLRQMERTAWLIIWVGFATFLTLAVSLPLSARWYLLNATQAGTAHLDKTGGTPVVYVAAGAAPSAVVRRTEIREGYEIATDGSSGAALDLAPLANASVQIYPQTQLAVELLRSPRFWLSGRPNQVVLTLQGGTIRVEDLGKLERSLRWTIRTPHGQVLLEADGSYFVEVNNDLTQVVIRRGQAELEADEATVKLFAEQRGIIPLDDLPQGPFAATRDLIDNGDFQDGLRQAWTATFCEGAPCNPEPGGVMLVEETGRLAARFLRTGGTGIHGENRIVQVTDRDVSEARSLVVALEVKLAHQELAGCGQLSTECPIIVRILYRDQYGSTADWLMGFYYADPPGQYALNKTYQKVLPGTWNSYESPDLLEVAPFTPHYIERLEIYASGWSYDSYVANVQLLIE